MPHTVKSQEEIEKLVSDLEGWRQRVFHEGWKELMPRLIDCVTLNIGAEIWGEHAAAERSISNSNSTFKRLLEFRELLQSVYLDFKN